ncbi:hemerythrin domain-containing protein [Bizionia sediminis]|uniref:Hemerythrin domain-containing protein n=1 Tax=Bizionia sediminis TaxID=1737064 RepID=A0ABW5KQ63_9FLAO
MTLKPLKRHKALQPLSREHHFGLLLCWKIRMGIKNNIAVSRIATYASWFYQTHLIPHFRIEETVIFPILEANHKYIIKALEDHALIEHLFKNPIISEDDLKAIEQALEQHIRFEERILFPEIQKNASEAQMFDIEKIHQSEPFQDNLTDEFWRKTD